MKCRVNGAIQLSVERQTCAPFTRFLAEDKGRDRSLDKLLSEWNKWMGRRSFSTDDRPNAQWPSRLDTQKTRGMVGR